MNTSFSNLIPSQLDALLEQEASCDPSTKNIGKYVRIFGDVDVDLLNRSHNLFLKYNDAFSIRFGKEQGSYTQYTSPFESDEIELFDFSQATDSYKKSLEIIDKELARHYTLFGGKLHSACIIKLTEHEFWYCIFAHHAITDNVSFDLWIKGVSYIYGMLASKNEPDEAVMASSFSEYIIKKSSHRKDKQNSKSMQYWASMHNESSNTNSLFKPASPNSYLYACSATRSIVRKALSDNLRDRLNTYIRESGQSASAVFISLLYLYFSRTTGLTDISIGMVTHNRRSAVEKTIVGNFIGTMPLRLTFDAQISFHDLVSSVTKIIRKSLRHTSYSYGELLRNVTRKNEHNRIFDVFYNQMRYSVSMTFGGIVAEVITPCKSTSNIPLMLNYDEGSSDNPAELIFEYETSQISSKEIGYIKNRLFNLIDQVFTDTQKPLSSYMISTREEQESQLYRWTDPEISCQNFLNIIKEFEAQAASTPNKTALVFNNTKLSYAELNQTSNKLAHYFLKTGFAQGDRVALCINRKPEMIQALLAILKIGATYIPLDPDYPAQRLQYILDNSQAHCLVTESKNKHTLFSEHNGKVLYLDNIDNALAECPTENTEHAIKPNDLAYIIYTSGSTGMPKGVQITHQNLINFLYSMQKNPGITERDRLLSVTTFSFDIAAMEFYLPLISGAELHLASDDMVRDGIKIAKYLTDNNITILQATPATWQFLLAVEWQGKNDLVMLCGGEAWPKGLFESLRNKVKEQWNMYGPTETTIWSAAGVVDNNRILIRGPVLNTQIYILDKYQQLCPPGVPGEIHIGGLGLAPGYWDNAMQTEERFILNPFASALSEKIGSNISSHLYRTGDIGCFTDDGDIEFIGRRDNQIKIRGYRIELGDIESALSSHPDVKRAAAILQEDESGQKHIVAYWVSQSNQSQESNERDLTQKIRHHLNELLPAYMMPSALVKLDSMPLTPNGKADRNALPKHTVNTAQSKTLLPPSNELEEKLLSIWATILHKKDISIDDNFFEIGGNSLLAVTLHYKIQEALEINFEAISLFENYSIKLFSNYILKNKKPEFSNNSITSRYFKRKNALKQIKHRSKREKLTIS